MDYSQVMNDRSNSLISNKYFKNNQKLIQIQ